MSPFIRTAGPCTAVALGAALILGPAAVATAAPTPDPSASKGPTTSTSTSTSASTSASSVRAGAAFVPLTIDGDGTFRPEQSLEVTGNATPAAHVYVVVRGGGNLGTDPVSAIADAAGRYAVTVDVVHGSGDVQVRAEQLSGHPTLDDRVDRTLTAARSAWAPVTIAGDRTFRPNTPLTVAGTAAPHATVVAHVGAQDVTGSADAAGRYSLTTEERLGVQPVTVAVGQVTGQPAMPGDSTAAEFTPAAVAFAPLVVDGDRTYQAGQPLTVRGTTTPYALVRVGVLGQVSDVVADATGTFAVTTGPIAAARVQVGISSSSTHPDRDRTLVLDYSSSTAVFVPLTIDGDRTFAPGQRLVLTGRATPAADVTATIGSGTAQQVVRGHADQDGRWSLTTDRPVGTTALPVVVEQQSTTAAGQDRVRATFTLTVDLVPTSLDSTTFRPWQVATVSGRGTPGATVAVWAVSGWSFSRVETTVGADGRWSLRSTSPLADEAVDVIVRQTSGATRDDTEVRLTPEQR